MKTIHMRSHVGSDGMLDLKVPVGVRSGEVDVTVIVEPVDNSAAAKAARRKEWEEFVDRTAGSIQDPTFCRQPQGDYEQREEFE